MNESSPKDIVGLSLDTFLEAVKQKLLNSAHITSGGAEHLINLSVFLNTVLFKEKVPTHIQVWVPSANAMVDSRVCVLIDLLNKIKIETAYCCEDLHDLGTGIVQLVIAKTSVKKMRKVLKGLRYKEEVLSKGNKAFILNWEEHLILMHRVLGKYLEKTNGKSKK